MDIGSLAQYGVAVVAIGVNLLIAKEFIRFLANHMSNNTKAMQDVATSLQSLKDEIRHK